MKILVIGTAGFIGFHDYLEGNSYVEKEHTVFSVVRYGNVLESRGSVIPFFLKQKETGEIYMKNITLETIYKKIIDLQRDVSQI